jgi:hypothetical protein
MSRLIAFTGPIGCGKSTAAEALIEEGWVRVKFADPLKNMLRSFYASCGIEDSAFVEARIEGGMKEEPDPFLAGRTPRHAMQTLGTEWGRNLIAPDLWTMAWQQRVLSMASRELDVVVDDCRFANEAAAVRSLGGMVVRIDGRSSGAKAKHASEKFDFEADLNIPNMGDRDQFMAYVIHVFDRQTAD